MISKAMQTGSRRNAQVKSTPPHARSHLTCFSILTSHISPHLATPAGIEASRTVVETLVQAEVEGGIPYGRIVLMGFSQGGALSLYTGLQMSSPLAGLLVLSGYLAGASSFKLNPATTAVPVLHCHGWPRTPPSPSP